MKKLFLLPAILLSVMAMTAFTPDGKPAGSGVEIGEFVPNLAQKLKDVSGEEMNLRDIKSHGGLLVVFSCNTCPFVLAWEDRYNEFAEICKKNDIGMVLVNSNEAKRDGADSFESMVKKANDEGYNCRYVVDADSELANAFGAKTTPHVYLFNPSMLLAYKGSIDNSEGGKKEVSKEFLKDAISNMVASKKIDPASTNSIGCSIKRVAK